jgi:hypothetical protein
MNKEILPALPPRPHFRQVLPCRHLRQGEAALSLPLAHNASSRAARGATQSQGLRLCGIPLLRSAPSLQDGCSLQNKSAH